jgi:putative transposase
VYSGNPDKAIGLGFSPAMLYVDDQGRTGRDAGYVLQKQAHKKELKKRQRRLDKRQIGSKNSEKERIKVARLERDIANQRHDFNNKEPLRLVRTYEVIGIEYLNLEGVSKFLKNAKNMNDSSWGEFVSKLTWLASKPENNCQIVKVDKFFPSSKLCHSCGYKKKDLTVSIREWTCPVSGMHHDRD